MRITRELLIILLNNFYLAGKRRLKVSFPPLGQLYSINLGEKATLKTQKEDRYYKTYSDKELKYEQEVVNEIPDHLDYRMLFQTSGILKPENYTELEEEVNRNSQRDLLKGQKPLFLGFDTNALRHRFPVLLQKILPQDARCGYVLHQGVFDELHPKMDKKLSKKMIEILKQRLGREYGKFFNQPPLEARKHKLGLVEYRKVKTLQYAEEISGKRGDLKIVKDYSEFGRKRNLDVFLFSEDNNFVEMARDNRLSAFHIIQKKELPETLKATWEELVELVYTTAIIYGWVKMGSATLYGVWLGKNQEDWNCEALKVMFEDEKLEEMVTKDVRITESAPGP